MMWCTAGARQILQLIIIAPLACRLRKGSNLLYRAPASLIYTDRNWNRVRSSKLTFSDGI